MREEIIKFHHEQRLTTIYVTHNLADGVALADRIAVMHRGRFVQVDSVENLIRRPATSYVADFFRAEQFGRRGSLTERPI
jgi:iron(III) transport system ATP-binding protein